MAKTFAAGQPLTAADINNELNPTTAPHIPYAVATGTIEVAGSTTNAFSLGTVVFPAGRFTRPPIVTASIATSIGSTYKLTARAYGATVSQCTVMIHTGDGAPQQNASGITVAWSAIQMSPTAAAG